MAKLVGRRYATALIDAGLELGMIEQFNEELDYIEDVFKREEKAFQIFSHPRINRDEKKQFISAIFPEGISQEMMNFLYILIDKKRSINLFEIIKEYEKLYNEEKNIVIVTAITVKEMKADSLAKLKNKLEKKLNKTIKISNEIDESMLGGVLLKVGEKVIDGTIIGQLEVIEEAIKGVS